MKQHTLQWFCLLLTLVLLAGVLFSCTEKAPQEPASSDTSDPTENTSKPSSGKPSNKTLAFQLYEKADQAMEKVDSYTGTNVTSLDYTMYGMRMVASSSATMFYTEHNTDQFRYRLQGESTVTVYSGTNKVSEVEIAMSEGFENGKMFYFSEYTEDGGAPQATKLYSKISAADYREFLKQTAEDATISPETCKNASCEQNEDNSWTAIYSGFDQKTIRKVGFGEFAEIFGSEVQCDDMTLTLTLTEDYYPMMLNAEFSFSLVDPENTEVSLPSLFVTSNYKDINTTNAPEAINLSSYSQVDDLRAKSLLDKALNDYLDSDLGKFDVVTASIINVQNQITNQSLTQMVSFANENGKLSFTIHHDDDGDQIKYVYKDGSLQTVYGNEQDSMPYPEQAARMTLFGTLHPMDFQMEDIENITVLSQSGNSVRYLIEFNSSEIVDEILQSGGALVSGNYGLTVALTDGKITEYSYSLAATFSYSGITMNMETTMTVDFHTAN